MRAKMKHLHPCVRCQRHVDTSDARCPFCHSPTHRAVAWALALAGVASLGACARAEASVTIPNVESNESQSKAIDGGARRDASAARPDVVPIESGVTRRRARRPSPPRFEDVPLYGIAPK